MSIQKAFIVRASSKNLSSAAFMRLLEINHADHLHTHFFRGTGHSFALLFYEEESDSEGMNFAKVAGLIARHPPQILKIEEMTISKAIRTKFATIQAG